MNKMEKELDAMHKINQSMSQVYNRAYNELSLLCSSLRIMVKEEKIDQWCRDRFRRAIAVADSCYKDEQTLKKQYEAHADELEKMLYKKEHEDAIIKG